MTRFYTPLTLLPTRGRWLLRLAQHAALSAGRGMGLWRLIGLGARIFRNWSDCPVIGPDGKPFWIDLRKGGFAYVTTGWCTAEIEPFTSTLPSDAIVLDIGANIGVWTRLLSAQCTAGHVYAFEPSPTTFRRLKRNCAIRHNVTCVHCALGVKNGMALFSGEEVDPKLRSIQNAAGGSTVEVATRRLDDWAREKGITRIDFVKIDVEGFEEDVLMPSLELLERFRPTLCFEFIPEFASTRSSYGGTNLIPALSRIGYQISRLDKKGEAFADFRANEDWTNDYLASFPGGPLMRTFSSSEQIRL